MTRWLYVPPAHGELLYACRAEAELEVAVAKDAGYWLRGFAAEAVPTVPGAELITVAEDGLHRAGERLPYAAVPRLMWHPLHAYLVVDAPAVQAPPSLTQGTPPQASQTPPPSAQDTPAVVFGLPWRLVPDPTPPAPTALWLDAAYCAQLLATEQSFASAFASVRLERLRFCWVDGRALLRGTPLLPLPGEAFAGEADLVPLGYRFEYPALAEELRQVLAKSKIRVSKAESDTLLWHADGRHTVLPGKVWQALTYANARYRDAGPARAAGRKVEWRV